MINSGLGVISQLSSNKDIVKQPVCSVPLTGRTRAWPWPWSSCTCQTRSPPTPAGWRGSQAPSPSPRTTAGSLTSSRYLTWSSIKRFAKLRFLLDFRCNFSQVWEQEIYLEFQYKNPKIGFHSFEAENNLAGLSFADDRSVTSSAGIVTEL